MFFHFGSNTINLNHVVSIIWEHETMQAEISMNDGTGWDIDTKDYLRLIEITGYSQYFDSRKSQD